MKCADSVLVGDVVKNASTIGLKWTSLLRIWFYSACQLVRVESPKRTSDEGGGWGYGGKQEGWGRVWKGVGITSRLKISPQICAPSKMSWRVNALVYP